MLTNIQELLDFIEYAKEQKIKSFQIGEIKVDFSELAFIDQLASDGSMGRRMQTEEKDTSKTLVDTLSEDNEDDLLFWSSKG